uniref:Uncharacterized protein n=1 Tax=Anguilla anguilla TaxID=7936 RepID=A0A0E9SJU5_ANGAN
MPAVFTGEVLCRIIYVLPNTFFYASFKSILVGNNL